MLVCHLPSSSWDGWVFRATQEHKYYYCKGLRLRCFSDEHTILKQEPHQSSSLFPVEQHDNNLLYTYAGHRHLLHQVIQDSVHVH